MTPRMINQNAPHQLSRNSEEMGTILPLHALVINQTHVGLIDQRRRLKAVAGTLASHVVTGEPSKFVINNGGQPVECASVSVTPCAKQSADLTDWRLLSLVVFR
jgi:hypothetical protein